MKKLFAFFACALVAVAGRAALPQPDLIAQIHFAGAQNISAGKDFAAFTNEFASAEARALANRTFDKLSRAPYAWFKTKLAPGAGDGAAQLRPLFDDLLKSEWIFEARDTAGGSPEYALAIRLSADRAPVWENNLRQLLEAWTKIPAQKIAGGWELKKHEVPDLIRFERRGGFVVVDCGQNQLELGDKILSPFLKTKIASAESNWLTADINWPRLAQWFPKLKALDLPETKFAVSTQNQNLRVNGNFHFPKNLSLDLKNWRLPTNTVHEPFVSFTAVRGIAAWLNSQGWYQAYGVAPAADQLFIWALPGIPFQTFVAAPFPNSTDALAQSYARLNPVFNSPKNQSDFFSPFKVALTNNEIHFQGVPFIAPYMQAVREPAGQFLLAGAFPNTPRGKPLPPELFRRLAEKNLVYYHWEITAQRLPQLLNLTQLGLVLTQHQQLQAGSAAMKWLQKITPKLGNTVTEIFQSAPDEMTFTRSAPGGLTAFELLALGNWLEAKNFPGCDLKLPPRPKFNRLHPPGNVRRPAAKPKH